MAKKKNPLVFLDVTIGRDAKGRMIFELFSDVVPKTAENFRALCTGEKGTGLTTGKPLHFKGCSFHRIIKGFMAQGGDFLRGDGKGGESIYGGKFADENFVRRHDGPGILSMANAGRDTNGSQFFITFKATPHLDGKHVVFGKLIQGHEFLKRLENVDTDDSRPIDPVKIIDCGQTSDASMELNEKKKAPKKKRGKETSSDSDSIEESRRRKQKKSSKGKKKRKRRTYSSESDSPSRSETESSDSESDSDDSSSSSSSSYSSSSDDDRRRKRKRSHKRDKQRRDKRKRDKKREKKRKHRTKKVKSLSESGCSDDEQDIGRRSKPSKIPVEAQRGLDADKNATENQFQNGQKQNNGVGASKSRSPSPRGGQAKRTGRSGSASSLSRSPSRKSPSPSPSPGPVRGRKGPSASPVAQTRQSPSPRRGAVPRRRTPSKSPARSGQNDLRRSRSRSGSPGGRVRRGRGFSQRYAYARRYRTPSPDRSPVRSHRYGPRLENRDRFPDHRGFSDRLPPRRYRSPPRRYRRSRSRSVSRSPRGYQSRAKSRSNSPVGRARGGGAERSRRRFSRSCSRSRGRSPSASRSPPVPLPRRASAKSSSPSGSSSDGAAKGLVAYGDGSPDSGQ